MTAGRKTPASTRPRAGTLKLGAECTRQQCGALRDQLVSRLRSRAAIVIDAGDVRYIDFSALQLLAAFVRDREARGRTTTWGAVAEPVRHAARRLAMHAMLGLPASGESHP